MTGERDDDSGKRREQGSCSKECGNRACVGRDDEKKKESIETILTKI